MILVSYFSSNCSNTCKSYASLQYWFYLKPYTLPQNKMNCELMLTYDTPTYMFNVYKNQRSQQTGSRNLMGPKTLPTILHTNMKIVTKYKISAINSCRKMSIICSMCIKINKVSKQEVGIWWVQIRFPRYGVPIWSLWPNIKFLPSIVAGKNVTEKTN